jgi:hypothetical protein
MDRKRRGRRRGERGARGRKGLFASVLRGQRYVNFKGLQTAIRNVLFPNEKM